MDGFEVLQALKADLDLQDIPVIFISATASMEDRVRALDLGAVDFVAKPFEVVELKARVRSALRVQHLVKMLAQRAQVDGLTGLWNRTYFDRRLLQEVSEATRHNRSLSLVMCDVDGFKRLNDERGHPFGDMVLERVAKILQGGRGSDVACRYGGEEFAIICRGTPLLSAGVLGERLRVLVEEENFDYQGTRLPVTISVGVAALPESNATVGSDLVRDADSALYEAKRSGRNRVCLNGL